MVYCLYFCLAGIKGNGVDEFNGGPKDNIGYLRAWVEKNSSDIDEIKKLIKDHMENEEVAIKELTNELRSIKDELNLYKFTVNGVKIFGGILLLILTLELGDIANLFK